MFTIEKDDQYLDELKGLSERFKRVQELEEAIVWALERNPSQIPNSVNITGGWFIWTTDEFFDIEMPRLGIVYEFREKDNVVHLQTIEESPAD